MINYYVLTYPIPTNRCTIRLQRILILIYILSDRHPRTSILTNDTTYNNTTTRDP